MVEISVIMPVYNAFDYLDEALGSIINQSFKDLEIICVDDGSTDNSMEKLYSFADQDSLFRSVIRKIRALAELQTQV